MPAVNKRRNVPTASIYLALPVISCWLIVLLACHAPRKSAGSLPVDKTTGLPVARRLYQLDSVQEGLLRGRHKALYRISNTTTAQPDNDEAEVAGDCHSLPKNCEDASFRGSDRKEAKLSFIRPQKRDPQPLQPLIDRLLHSDASMKNHEPAISSDCNSIRQPEEKENVYLEGVYIYVILREDDGDYHLIVGDGINAAPETLLSVEISALPETTSSFYSTLKKVRNDFEKKFSTCSRKNLWNHRAENPLPKIAIKGTLFYDIRHAKQGVHSGDGAVKTATFWEVHPATYFKLLN